MASARKDYYQILGIGKNAELADIKKAYKKLALKWHPDKNPDNQAVAQKKFQDIAEAYSVLSDKKKRQEYDLGEQDQNTGDAAGHAYDNFQQFGGYNDFGNFYNDIPQPTYHQDDSVSFAQAEEIFRKFFGGKDPFSTFEEDDDFFDDFLGFKGNPKVKSGHSGFFDDDFGFGNMGFGNPSHKSPKPQYNEPDFGYGNDYMYNNPRGNAGYGKSYSYGVQDYGASFGSGGYAGASKRTTTVAKDGNVMTKSETVTIAPNGERVIRLSEEAKSPNRPVQQRTYAAPRRAQEEDKKNSAVEHRREQRPQAGHQRQSKPTAARKFHK